MNALAFDFADMECDLDPEPLFHIDPTDKDKASELERQAAFVARFRKQCLGGAVVAVPNGSKRGQKALNQAKKEGAAWGFPDVIAILPGFTAYLEFKDGKKPPRPNQIDWLNWLTRANYPCGVFRTADTAMAFLRTAYLDHVKSARTAAGVKERIIFARQFGFITDDETADWIAMAGVAAE